MEISKSTVLLATAFITAVLVKAVDVISGLGALLN